MKNPLSSLSAAAGILASAALSVHAQTTQWTETGAGSWFDAANWNNGVPVGVGNASVSNGGTSQIASGSAAVAMRANFGNNLGPGTLEITDGSLTVGDNINLGSTSVGAAGSGTLLVSGSNATLTVNSRAFIGIEATGNMTVANGGRAVFNFSAGNFSIGTFASGTGFLSLQGTSGARGVVEANGMTRGDGSGTITFDGGILRALSNWGDFLQNFGAGDVTINSGGAFIDSNGFVIGISTVLGGTGTLTKIGTGTLTLTGSNTYSGGTIIENGTMAVGSGGSINHGAAQMNVGTVLGQTGTLAIGAGGSVTNHRAFVGFGGTGAVTVNGSEATWTNAEHLYVGNTTTGSLDVSAGGSVSVADRLFVANASGVQGTVTVSGTGSSLSMLAGFIGRFGSGVLNLADGGTVTVDGGAGPLYLSFFGNSSGTLNIGTGGLAGVLNAGVVNGVSETGNTSAVNFNHTDNITFAPQLLGILSVNKLASGTTILTGMNTYTGGTYVQNGILRAGNANAFSQDTGYQVNGGELDLNGFNLTADGFSGTGGTVNLGSATFTVDQMFDTEYSGNIIGSGGLTLKGGGSLILSGANTYAGATHVDDGDLTISGTSFNSTTAVTVDAGSRLFIGQAGEFFPAALVGSIAGDGLIRGNGLISAFAWGVDNTSTTFGGVINGTILAGKRGSGTTTFTGSSAITQMIVTEGGIKIGAGGALGNTALSMLGSGSNSPVLDLDGNTLRINSLLGSADANILLGSGTLTLSGSSSIDTNFSGTISGAGSLVKNGRAVLILDGDNTFTGLLVNTGTVQIGTSGTNSTGRGSVAGNIENQGTLIFSRDNIYSYGGAITGAGSILKRGLSTLTLTGTNSYTGTTAINAGKLLVNGVNSGTGAVSVASGAALGGTGTIGGAVTVANGGTMAPGASAGTLTVASLSLNTSSILDYELGAPAGPNDRIEVLGDLTLNGILNITNLGGFGPGEYLLMTYGGSLTGDGLTFGLVPGAYDFSLDTTGNQVNLTVALATAQYWNGPNETPVPGSPTGGSGTWDNALTNWTNAAGNANTAWTGALPAIFSGTAGTVTVADTINVAEMRFLTDGYVVTGTGALAISGTTLTLLADPDVSAEIETVITGTGGVVKNGAGEVILSGTNTFSGGTRHVAGTLLVNDDSALGTGTLALADGTTFGVKDNLVVLGNNVSVDGDVSIRAAAGLDFSGTMSLGVSTRTLTFTEDLSSVCFMGPITGDGGLSLLTEDGFTVDLTMCGPESNTYSGLTTVGSGVELLLMKDPDAVAIAGDLLIQDNAFVEVLELEGSSVTQISSDSSVTIEGTGELAFLYLPLDPVYAPLEQTLAGLFGDGTLSSEAGSINLTVLEGDFSGVITDGDSCGCGGDPLALFKSGAETLILSGSNSYRGGTTISQGTLQTNHVAALGTGPVALTGGTFEPMSALTIDSMDWSGGAVARTLDTTPELLTILNDLTVTGAGGTFDFTAGAGFLPNLTFDLLSAANLDVSMLGLFSGNALLGLAPVFSIDGTTLEVTFAGTPVVGGPVLQNSAPVGTPVFADFLVNGPVTTGTPTESNTIRGLRFNPGSSLQIFNNLTVTSGDFTVPTGSATVTGGNVVVPGTFSKLGAGLLDIFSNVFVSGPANLVAGSLLVNGSFTAGGGLTVFQNALLGGAGVINGNLINNGTVAPGNSPGTLTVNGNYTQTASGALQIEPGDLLLVSGRASLAGTLQLVAAGKLQYGQQITFLRAGSISGEFDEILMPNPNRFRGRFLAEDGVGTLLVAPASYTLVAETTNQRNVAKALDSYIPARGDDREAVSLALDLQSEEQYPAAFDQIAPTYYESLGNITIEQAFVQSQQLNQRLSAVRMGARGFQSIGISSPLVHDKDGKSVFDAKDAKNVLPQSALPNPQWNIWAMGNGLFGKVTNVSQVPNYNFNSGGFLFGADYTLGRDRSPNGPSKAGGDNQPSLTLGLYGGYQYTWADAGDSGNTQINSALFGGYATYTNGGFYADGIVGGGYNGYRVRRGITFSTIDRTARSQPNGGQFNASLNLGYDWEIGRFTLGPIAGVQYAYAGIAPFSETGAESLDLRVGQQNVNSLRTTFGGRVAYTWNVTDKIALIPEVRMFWQHEFLNNPRNISSALDGGAGPTFGYETSAPARDSVFAGAGISAQFGERWNAFFYWNVDFGRQDYFGNSISGGLNWRF